MSSTDHRGRRMIRRIAGLAVVATLTLAGTAHAVTLVTPHDKPVAGAWQRWANEAKEPTIATRVILGPQSICDIADVAPAQGCSTWDAPWELYASGRYSLYFELGHLFDRARLTWQRRGTLAKIWGVYGHPWNDTTASLDHGREDGLMVDFAAAYAACAEGDRLSGLQSGDAPAIHMGDTCQVISKIK